MVRRAHIAGVGGYLPERVMTNAELARLVDTSDEWIVERTGIRQRHIAAEGEFTSHLALKAADKAMAAAGIGADTIDLVVVATATPDNTFPATATRVQAELGMVRGAAFDIQAVCSGFIYALAVADNFIKAGQAGTRAGDRRRDILAYSRLDTTAPPACCSATAPAPWCCARDSKGTASDRGILSTHLHSDGQLLRHAPGRWRPSRPQTVGHLRMEGREVFRHAVVNLADVVEETLAANGLSAGRYRLDGAPSGQ